MNQKKITANSELHDSGEDYLEAILILEKQKGEVRSIDLAQHMGYSKPSISHAVAMLQSGGFLIKDACHALKLTPVGREVAERIYERHKFFSEQLIAAGVDPQTAESEACRMEHAISYTSFQKIKESSNCFFNSRKL